MNISEDKLLKGLSVIQMLWFKYYNLRLIVIEAEIMFFKCGFD